MKRYLFLLLLGSLSLLMVADARAKNQKETVPAVFKNAVFVYVQAYNGDALNPHVIPDDREAIYRVEQGLKAWKRYSIVYELEKADLVFLVRKGRIASVTPGVEVNIGRQPQNRNPSPPDPTRSGDSVGVGVGVDAEAGPADDLLSICLENPSGALLWSHSLKGGLDSPGLPLLQRVEHEVDTAYPK
jgi:hypothetical protein